jgi:hypothetical protein
MKRLAWSAALVGLLELAGVAACGGQESSATSFPCGAAGPAANNSFDSAPPLEVGADKTGCIGQADTAGADFATLTAPDGTAGYAHVQIDQIAAGAKVRVTVYGQTHDAELGHVVAADVGGGLEFFLALAAGTTYRLAVRDEGTFVAPYTYRMTSSFTPVADAYEPNDSVAAAASMSAGAPIDAFLFAGATTASLGAAAHDDYYRVALAADQSATVRISNLPTDVAARLFFYSADGVELARVTTGHKGEALTLVIPALAAAADFAIGVSVFSEAPPTLVAGATPPDHFTRAYSLSITQP